ncbi:MAG: hypothetical protein DCF28_01230 [Alphaproteobacteria bacterium]|nr:MAG: hypothetical protein DCF28_01230 [Alphaproteobacteria bacterium]
MKGRWRLFRHEAGMEAGPPPVAYVALYCACILIGFWSARTFDAIVIWPTNGVMLAALLQLHRRQAIWTVAVCFAINLASNMWRGDPMPFLIVNPVMNLFQVLLAALLVRRVGGAALDLRRPQRLVAVAVLAILPAVALSALIMVSLAATIREYSLPVYIFTLQRYFGMELLGLLIVTPALLLMARAHRFRGIARASRLEVAALMSLLVLVTTGVFTQNIAPLLFLIFPAIVLIAFRLSPPWVAASIMIIAVIGAIGSLSGQGPVMMTRLLEIPGLDSVQDLQRRLSLYYLFLLVVIMTAVPLSTLMSERRRLMDRLEARTLAAQAARRQAEQSAATKGRFLALMSHEMRTPLHSVVGYAEVLGRRSDIKADARRQADLIQDAGNSLLVLVEDVLEVSRGTDTLCLGRAHLPELLAQAVAPCREIAELKGLTLRLEVEPGARLPIRTDAKRLRQAVHKLVDNAVKFTRVGHVLVQASREGDAVTLTVSDTGCGIDLAILPDVFDPFFQSDDSICRDHVGAGLGLAVARQLIERLGGRITVESRTGHGSCFTITLPLPAFEMDLESIETEVVATRDVPPRVLVVDDHAGNREVARLMLAPTGAEIAEARDGLEAVEMAKTQAFDLILMDVRMPRMDGLAATRAIRALGGPSGLVPILAVTADAMPEDAERCLAAGMNGHLAKPITHTTLYAAIDQVIGGVEATPDAEAA